MAMEGYQGNTTTNNQGNSMWMQLAMAGLQTGANAIAKGGPKRQYKYAKKFANYQNQMNRENAEWVLAQNRALTEEQRLYDSPAQQMARYKAAGLNPHLVYSQGSPGNMNSPVTVGSLPSPSGGNIDTSYGPVGSDFGSAMLMQSQRGLTNQKIEESRTKQALTETQNEVLKANPFLRPAYVDAVVRNMDSIASIKESEAILNNFQAKTYLNDSQYTVGEEKIIQELNTLKQKYNLDNADLQIKARVIEGKDFENDLKEIQKKWLQDGDINAEHIRQFIMMFLGSLIKKR